MVNAMRLRYSGQSHLRGLQLTARNGSILSMIVVADFTILCLKCPSHWVPLEDLLSIKNCLVLSMGDIDAVCCHHP